MSEKKKVVKVDNIEKSLLEVVETMVAYIDDKDSQKGDINGYSSKGGKRQ